MKISVKEVLLDIQSHLNEYIKSPTVAPLKQIVAFIRPKRAKNVAYAIAQIEHLKAYMDAYPELKNAFYQYVQALFLKYNPINLYTESGIYSSKSFWTEAFEKLGYKLLPPIIPAQELKNLLNELFYKSNDYIWVKAVPSEKWIELLNSIGFLSPTIEEQPTVKNHLLNAALILTQKIAAIGLENEITSKLPAVEDLQSPFFALTREVTAYVDKFKHNPAYHYINEEDYRQILVMLKQCQESILILRKQKDKYGVSLYLTWLTLRLEQHIKRLKTILAIIQENHPNERNLQIVSLFKELVEAENTKYNLSRHFSENLSLISYKIVEHTSQTGEHYIATTPREYNILFKSALGGGVIVAFLVCLKIIIYYLHAAKFWEAFLYSMNYSLGFILIHLFHFTLATKQPAMTASTIAHSLDKQKDLTHLSSAVLIRQLVRSQMVSLLGNVLAVFPIACLLSYAYLYFMDTPIADEEKALKMIKELHPMESGSLLYAAIAGVYLMLAGLISGWYDNKVIYGQIPLRIKAHPFLRKLFPEKWLNRLADYIGKNLGGLAGNFYLGIFLGSTATVGFIIGLPLDIRHVTFAAGSFGVSTIILGENLDLQTALWTVLGILGIGLVNVSVSFGLSMLIALKSRKMSIKQVRKLITNTLVLPMNHHKSQEDSAVLKEQSTKV